MASGAGALHLSFQYLKKKVTVVWAWAGKRETDPELAGGLAHPWEHAGHVGDPAGRVVARAARETGTGVT